jgi:hypothetical protein
MFNAFVYFISALASRRQAGRLLRGSVRVGAAAIFAGAGDSQISKAGKQLSTAIADYWRIASFGGSCRGKRNGEADRVSPSPSGRNDGGGPVFARAAGFWHAAR